MFRSSQQRLQRLTEQGRQRSLLGGLKGLEKESLRVEPDGRLAQTPHPAALGSALTHPSITTDYSEALLEFITAPHADLADTLGSLSDVHRFVYHRLGGELLWTSSMPCIVGSDDSIPIAWYGRSNTGMMKHVYRRGLAWRYGRRMQAIAGVHFNYSLPETLWPLWQQLHGDDSPEREFRSEQYFHLIRNLQRLGWLIPYLFGASPALCRSFLDDPSGFERWDAHTLYAPYATSLRMSDIGYKNKAQAGMNICYNRPHTYIDSLEQAIRTPEPDYQAIGVQIEGEYRQLNANLLQIENEYYSFVRPKSVALNGERPSLALARNGVQYVEVRALDLDPFTPAGVAEPTLRFLEALLLLCLLEDSPPMSGAELAEVNRNQALVAREGRRPGLTLQREGAPVTLQDWSEAICQALEPLCALLDSDDPARPYAAALAQQRGKIADPATTPSARVLAEMTTHGESFVAFALRKSHEHRDTFLAQPLTPELEARMDAEAIASLERQRAIEAADTISFEAYLERYFAEG